MTLADNQAIHRTKVRNWTLENLRADKVFKALCREDEEFFAWVLDQRPDMTRKTPVAAFKPKFLGLHPIQPEPAKVQPAKREAVIEEVEEVNKTVQLYRDVVVYAEKSNNLF